MRSRLATFDEPAWYAAAGTAASYLVIIMAMFVLLFVIPLAIFALA